MGAKRVGATVTGVTKMRSFHDNLDGKVGGQHSHEHTEALMDALDEKVLWVDYSIVSSIMVHPILFPQFFF